VIDRRAMLLVLAAAATAAAVLVPRLVSPESSGPLSAEEYRDELRKSLDGFELSAAGGEDALDGLAEKFRSAGERLGDVEPPADVAMAHDRLVAGLRRYGDWLDELSGSGRQGAIEYEMRLAEQDLTGQQWVEAFNELARKGYLTSPAP
jgi:hypothetical protein